MRRGAAHPAIEMETLQVLYSINDRLGALCAENGLKAGRDFEPIEERVLIEEIYETCLAEANESPKIGSLTDLQEMLEADE